MEPDKKFWEFLNATWSQVKPMEPWQVKFIESMFPTRLEILLREARREFELNMSKIGG